MFSLFSRKDSPKPKRFSPITLEPPHDYTEVDHFLRVVEVSDAAPFVGNLFQRKFGAPPPDYPRHFVSFYAPQGSDEALALGYYHQTKFENSYLAGGLVINERAYRQLPKTHRHQIKEAGGIAEHLSIKTFELLGDQVDAIWGHVGNPQAKKVDIRVGGLQISNSEHLMVLWRNNNLSERGKQALTQKVAALPPF